MIDPTVLRIRRELFEHEDKAYREFNIKTNPGAEHSIGVRIPVIRRIAKDLICGDYSAYLDGAGKEFFEEIMLEGILIATAPMSPDERFCRIRSFVPKIADWCVCDTFCNSLRSFVSVPEVKDKMWEFILQYRESSEFEKRFMLVMILDHFISAEYLPEIFRILDELGSFGESKNNSAYSSMDGVPYYSAMAAAWLLAEIIALERDAAFSYLQSSKLPTSIYNKGLQKARESYRVAPGDKKLLREMRR